MKTYNKFIVALMGAGLMTLSSCHMDIGPQTSMKADMDSIINDNLTLEAMERGMYTSFRSTYYGAASELPEFMCDGFNATANYGNNMGPLHRTDASFTASDQDTEVPWANYYGAIKNYNIFLQHAERFLTTPNLPEATLMVGKRGIAEAKFFRAVAYLSLVRTYAKAYDKATAATELGVPLVLIYDQKAKPARATVQQVYDQIFKDLNEASDSLLVCAKYFYSKNDATNFYAIYGKKGVTQNIHVSLAAVDAMLARYYLDTQDYENAAAAAEAVIEANQGYTLASDKAAMEAEYENDNGTESIMQLPATLTENGSGTNSYYTRADYYSALAGAGYPGGGIYLEPYYLPSQKLIDLYDKKNDLRFAQWFVSNADYTIYLSGYFLTANRFPLYAFGKYFGNPELNSDGIPNARQHVKPFLIGEQYLIAAEAYAMKGDVANAKKYLNLLQEARGAEATDGTMEFIKTEWFKETVGEGLRMSCLKRWNDGYTGRALQPGLGEYGMADTGTNYDGKEMKADDVHWQWPIPAYEIRVNDNLKQNDGY